MSAAPLVEVMFLITKPEKDTKQQARMSVQSACTARTMENKEARESFYPWSWKIRQSKREITRLIMDSTDVKASFDTYLRSLKNCPDNLTLDIYVNPTEPQLQDIQDKYAFQEDPTVVDLQVTPKRPSKYVESGHIAFVVGHCDTNRTSHPTVSSNCQIVREALRSEYFKPGQVDIVLASTHKGSSLQEGLDEHLEKTLRNLYFKHGWDYDRSVILISTIRTERPKVS